MEGEKALPVCVDRAPAKAGKGQDHLACASEQHQGLALPGYFTKDLLKPEENRRVTELHHDYAVIPDAARTQDPTA